jgi:hypothetical protein
MPSCNYGGKFFQYDLKMMNLNFVQLYSLVSVILDVAHIADQAQDEKNQACSKS